jgi:hypothetical protein
VIWNRTDEQFGRRLDGAIVRVLDAQRRPVRTVALDEAGARWGTDFVPDSVELRRTAARVLGALAGASSRTAPAVGALAKRWNDETIGAAASDALASIPVDSWPSSAADAVTRALSAALAQSAGAPVDRSWLALADALSARSGIDAALALDLRRARRNSGAKVALIRPVPDSLTYDKQLVTVAAGRPI